MPLTVRQIDTTPPTDRTQRLWDGGGMYLEIPPTGSKRWRLKYRHGGREKLISLGVYPEVSLREAREARQEARALLRQGIDPSAHRKALRRAPDGQTLEALAREWHASRDRGWARSHSVRVLRLLERDILPALGGRIPSEITAPELLDVLRRIEGRGAVDTAHRAQRVVGQVLRYGIATGRAERDISADLRGALPPVKRGHFGAVIEPEDIGGLLRAIDGYGGHAVTRWALRLAPYVFVRPGELRQAEWSEVDLDAATWVVPAAKVKWSDIDHVIPLSTQAVGILREAQRLSGDLRYVFPGARSRLRPLSDNALSAALRRMGYSGSEATIHGLRATARTVLDEVLGVRPDIIEHQLAHRVRDPNGRAYNRTAHLDARRDMMQRWADHLDHLRQSA